MNHRTLRALAIGITLGGLALAVSGCANPWLGGPSAGGVSFKWQPDCSGEYQNNGRDIDTFSGEITCPNGARGKFRVAGARGAGSADNAVNAQAQLNALLIAMLGTKIPNLGAILAAGGMPVPPVP